MPVVATLRLANHLTWQNPEQFMLAQVLTKKYKLVVLRKRKNKKNHEKNFDNIHFSLSVIHERNDSKAYHPSLFGSRRKG